MGNKLLLFFGTTLRAPKTMCLPVRPLGDQHGDWRQQIHPIDVGWQGEVGSRPQADLLIRPPMDAGSTDQHHRCSDTKDEQHLQRFGRALSIAGEIGAQRVVRNDRIGRQQKANDLEEVGVHTLWPGASVLKHCFRLGLFIVY